LITSRQIKHCRRKLFRLCKGAGDVAMLDELGMAMHLVQSRRAVDDGDPGVQLRMQLPAPDISLGHARKLAPPAGSTGAENAAPSCAERR